MDNTEESRLIDPNETIKSIFKMNNAYMIVGGKEDQVYGTLDFRTMFIWTSKEKAQDFIKKKS